MLDYSLNEFENQGYPYCAFHDYFIPRSCFVFYSVNSCVGRFLVLEIPTISHCYWLGKTFKVARCFSL